MMNSETLDDKRLVQQTLAGERDAFNVLVERHFTKVYAVTYAWSQSHADAEDAAQETFIKAYTALNTLRDANRFGAWLVTIARRICHNLSRKNQRQREIEEQVQDAPPIAATDIEQRESADLIRRQLDYLKASEREILMLRYYANHSVREIAALLSISSNATAKRLQRAREALGAQLLNNLSVSPDEAQHHSKHVSKITGAIAVTQAPWSLTAAQAAGTAGIITATGINVVAAVSVLLLGVVGTVYYLSRPDPAAPAKQPTLGAPTATAIIKALQEKQEAKEHINPPAVTTATPEPVAVPVHAEPAPTETQASPAPMGILEGVITDGNASPVPDAQVAFILMQPASGEGQGVRAGVSAKPLIRTASEVIYTVMYESASPEFTTQSDRQGRFTFPNIPVQGDAVLRVRADGFIPLRHPLTLAETNEDVEICLDAGIVVHGRVLTSRKKPVSDAAIQRAADAISGPGSARGSSRVQASQGRVPVDKDGYFSLTIPEHGLLTLKATSPTRGTAFFNNIDTEIESPILLHWPDSTDIYGTITQPDGTPAAGYTLNVSQWFEQQMTVIPSDERDAAEGIESLEQDSFVGSTVRVRGNTERSGAFGGGGGMGGAMTTGTHLTQTDGAGKYQITGLTPGQQYQISITDPQGTTVARRLELGAIPERPRYQWNYRIEKACVLEGKIVATSSGKPLAGITIHCNKLGAPHPVPSTTTCTSDTNGVFTLRIIDGAGEYAVTPRYPRNGSFHSPAPEEAFQHIILLQPNQQHNTIEVALPLPHARSFRVVDAEGNPVPGCMVDVQEFMVGGSHSWDCPGSTDAEGRITITGLAPDIDIQCHFFKGRYVAESARYYAEAGERIPEERIVLFPLENQEGGAS